MPKKAETDFFDGKGDERHTHTYLCITTMIQLLSLCHVEQLEIFK